eukprot:8736354-Alexandrium_andersonii.AAC.1
MGRLPRNAAAADGAAWVANAVGLGGLAGPAAWADRWLGAPRPAGGRPLRGLGELSAEHLLPWCPAVWLPLNGRS